MKTIPMLNVEPVTISDLKYIADKYRTQNSGLASLPLIVEINGEFHEVNLAMTAEDGIIGAGRLILQLRKDYTDETVQDAEDAQA